LQSRKDFDTPHIGALSWQNNVKTLEVNQAGAESPFDFQIDRETRGSLAQWTRENLMQKGPTMQRQQVNKRSMMAQTQLGLASRPAIQSTGSIGLPQRGPIPEHTEFKSPAVEVPATPEAKEPEKPNIRSLLEGLNPEQLQECMDYLQQQRNDFDTLAPIVPRFRYQVLYRIRQGDVPP
jgi:hypothetical protein